MHVDLTHRGNNITGDDYYKIEIFVGEWDEERKIYIGDPEEAKRIFDVLRSEEVQALLDKRAK